MGLSGQGIRAGSGQQSMVIRNSNSTNNISYSQKKAQQMLPTNSKSVLTSFRNGPVKVLNSAASSGQIGCR